MEKKNKGTGRKVASPHDRLFKTSMSDIRVARDFFERHLDPEILAIIDLNSLKLNPNTYIDKELELTASDVLYETTIAGSTALLYTLIEHQSTVDHMMPFRLWEYQIAIIREYLKKDPRPHNNKKIPLIFPIVFYAGKEHWNASMDLKNLIEAPCDLIEKVLYAPAPLIDMSLISDEELMHQAWSGALAYFLKNSRKKRDILLTVEYSLGLLRSLEALDGYDYVYSLLNYIVERGDTQDPMAFVKLIEEGLSHEVGDEMMNLLQRFKNEGRQLGRQEGMQEGMQLGNQTGVHTGESRFLVMILTNRFHHVSPFYMEKIKTASPETLLMWGQVALEAKSIEEVFGMH
jgi:predicted transposase YdaD